jgi:hypothetical protein
MASAVSASGTNIMTRGDGKSGPRAASSRRSSLVNTLLGDMPGGGTTTLHNASYCLSSLVSTLCNYRWMTWYARKHHDVRQRQGWGPHSELVAKQLCQHTAGGMPGGGTTTLNLHERIILRQLESTHSWETCQLAVLHNKGHFYFYRANPKSCHSCHKKSVAGITTMHNRGSRQQTTPVRQPKPKGQCTLSSPVDGSCIREPAFLFQLAH